MRIYEEMRLFNCAGANVASLEGCIHGNTMDYYSIHSKYMCCQLTLRVENMQSGETLSESVRLVS